MGETVTFLSVAGLGDTEAFVCQLGSDVVLCPLYCLAQRCLTHCQSTRRPCHGPDSHTHTDDLAALGDFPVIPSHIFQSPLWASGCPDKAERLSS